MDVAVTVVPPVVAGSLHTIGAVNDVYIYAGSTESASEYRAKTGRHD